MKEFESESSVNAKRDRSVNYPDCECGAGKCRVVQQSGREYYVCPIAKVCMSVHLFFFLVKILLVVCEFDLMKRWLYVQQFCSLVQCFVIEKVNLLLFC